MYDPKRHTDESLEFTRADCLEAVRANPGGHKAIEYIQLSHACGDELGRRARLRIWRESTRKELRDSLQTEIRHRRWVSNSNYAKDRFKSACFCLAWYRLYNLI